MRRALLPVALLLSAAIGGYALAQSASTSPPPAIQSTNAIQTCVPTVTTLAALNAQATLSCPGAANYIVKIEPVSGQSAFIGTLQASADGNSWRTRRWFRTGIGELDTSNEKLDGTQASLEYRLSGGDSATVVATAYTSGQALVTITGSYNTAMVFLNGPIHTADEAAVRAGRGFRLAQPLTTVAANQFFNFALVNPAGSGRNIFIQGMWVCQTSGTVLQLSQRLTVGAQSGTTTPTTVTPVNRRPDSTMASVLTAAAGASTATITTGTLGAQVPLLPTGACTQIQEIDMLTPGQSLGLSVAGVGNVTFGTASSISAYVEEYEEGVN